MDCQQRQKRRTNTLAFSFSLLATIEKFPCDILYTAIQGTLALRQCHQSLEAIFEPFFILPINDSTLSFLFMKLKPKIQNLFLFLFFIITFT